MINEITEDKQNKLEAIIKDISKFDAFERRFAEAIWITSGYDGSGIENYADSYSVLEELISLGISSFANKKSMDKRIKYLITDIKSAGENPDEYFKPSKRSLPTKGKTGKNQDQIVFKISKLGLMALFVSLSKYRYKMFKVANTLDKAVLLLPTMGQSKFIDNLMQDNITIDAFMTTGDVLVEELPSLSMVSHYKQWREMVDIGQGTDPEEL